MANGLETVVEDARITKADAIGLWLVMVFIVLPMALATITIKKIRSVITHA